MKAPHFWWQKPRLASFDFIKLAFLLPVGLVIGYTAAKRMRQTGEKAALPIICVGNPIAGGAGKTPIALMLAKFLAEDGLNPFFLTRGYGGTLSGPVQVNAIEHSARHVGDEALLLARMFPTIVSHDRPAGVRLAKEMGATVIVMDDGFQNPSLKKDLSFLVIDAEAGIGNSLPIPAGPLRAPLSEQVRHADAVIVMGHGSAASPLVRKAAKRALPIFSAHLKQVVPSTLFGKSLFAFAGIGRPEKFFDGLRRSGLNVQETRSFEDHHAYTENDAERLLHIAQDRGLTLVTTAKDHVRLEGGIHRARLSTEAVIVPANAVFEDEKPIRKLLKDATRGFKHSVPDKTLDAA
jgi:tetraacyldisaccharide 4'-kinase